MENFKFILSSILIVVLLGFAGYWAFSTIESGSTHVDSQKQKELEQENKNLTKEVTDLKKEIGLLQADKEQALADQVQANLEAEAIKIPVATTLTPAKPTVSKNQSLINELQKLVDGKIYLKLKSQGPAVGTVQKFLNIYNKTSNKIDNDYGASTKTTVLNFQKAQGLTADGETGPSTYSKMISWLKSH
ncbi:MAG: peptidoglycan-binding protein [Candidatus Paceibacterota bacterium]